MPEKSNPILVWFRQDLRLADNPALHAACKTGQPVIPVFIWSPEEEKNWIPGSASQVWLHHALVDLNASLNKLGSRLILCRGKSLEVLDQLARRWQATHIFWNRRYEPLIIERDKKIKAALTKTGMTAESFNGSLLFEPWEILNGQGKPYQVFTPFWKALQSKGGPSACLPAPKKMLSPAVWPDSLELDTLALLPKISWHHGIEDFWRIRESAAHKQLADFSAKRLRDYPAHRDMPETAGTSRLSPYLHFGQISPRQIWHALAMQPDALPYLRQIAWREFAHHLLYHFPKTPEAALRESFDRFPWQSDQENLRAWQRGQTGYPIVDAGMRELWHTGWMHNRVRMIAGSFLVKDLLISWQEGARWFWDTLVDADLANNTMGWQWIAGCGADAAPFFRIFNPVLQGEKFDPQGNYVRRWVPELNKLSPKWIHKPWLAPEEDLMRANITLGQNYPKPVVDHEFARRRALAALSKTKTR